MATRPLVFPKVYGNKLLMGGNIIGQNLNQALSNYAKMKMQKMQMQQMAGYRQAQAAMMQAHAQQFQQQAEMNKPGSPKNVKAALDMVESGVDPGDAMSGLALNNNEQKMFTSAMMGRTRVGVAQIYGDTRENVAARGLEGVKYRSDHPGVGRGGQSIDDKIDQNLINHYHDSLIPKLNQSNQKVPPTPEEEASAQRQIGLAYERINARRQAQQSGSPMPPSGQSKPQPFQNGAGPMAQESQGPKVIPFDPIAAKAALPGDTMNVPGKGWHVYTPKNTWSPVASPSPQSDQPAPASAPVEAGK